MERISLAWYGWLSGLTQGVVVSLQGLSYVAGKVSFYAVVGAAIIQAGFELQTISIPVVIAARKALGPLMIIIGLGLAGVWRPRVAVGQRLALRLREQLPIRGAMGAYLLGVGFSFAFCPTLFWLFFGLTIPLALRSAAGWAFPGLFAVGTALPLLVFTGLLVIGTDLAQGFVARVRRSHRLIGRIAGAIFVLAGIHDTLTYWAL